MSKVVKVLLNQQENGGQNYLKFVGGKKANDNYPENDNREFQYGISLFYNDKYILNFVLLEDEVELLQSDMKIKVVDDLSYILIAKKYQLTIMKNKGVSYFKAPENELEKRIGALAEKQGWYAVNTYNEVEFTSEAPDVFGKALKIAMENAFTNTNLFVCIPDDAEEVEL